MLIEEVQSWCTGLWLLMANWWMRLTPRDRSLSARKVARMSTQICQRRREEKQQGNVLSCDSPSIQIQSERLSWTFIPLSWGGQQISGKKGGKKCNNGTKAGTLDVSSGVFGKKKKTKSGAATSTDGRQRDISRVILTADNLCLVLCGQAHGTC